MYQYDTVVSAVNGLKERGFTLDFNVDSDKIICSNKKHSLESDDFEIVEIHRFEGDSNPSDEDVVYAVESKDGKLKGVITSAFGTYADGISSKMLSKLTIHQD